MIQQTIIPGEGGACCVADEEDFLESPKKQQGQKTSSIKKSLNDARQNLSNDNVDYDIVHSPTDKTKPVSYDEEDYMEYGGVEQIADDNSICEDPPAAGYPVTRQGSSFRRRKAKAAKLEESSILPTKCGKKTTVHPSTPVSSWQYILQISAFAVIGCSVRVFLTRLFGEDCEDQDVQDFMTPFSSQICLTSGGKSIQHGGALFWDLPANIIGSFLMGLITPEDAQRTSRIPWHKRDHPFQQDDVFHTSLGVGLCGCITTFASWNTQMVVMLVRTSKGFKLYNTLRRECSLTLLLFLISLHRMAPTVILDSK